MACELFLEENGMVLNASDEDCIEKTIALAAGEIDEHAYAAWLKESAQPA